MEKKVHDKLVVVFQGLLDAANTLLADEELTKTQPIDPWRRLEIQLNRWFFALERFRQGEYELSEEILNQILGKEEEDDLSA